MYCWVTGTDLKGFDEFDDCGCDGDYKVAELIRALGGKVEGLTEGYDEIWFPELPTVREFGPLG
jgi:hypothetical protein